MKTTKREISIKLSSTLQYAQLHGLNVHNLFENNIDHQCKSVESGQGYPIYMVNIRYVKGEEKYYKLNEFFTIIKTAQSWIKWIQKKSKSISFPKAIDIVSRDVVNIRKRHMKWWDMKKKSQIYDLFFSSNYRKELLKNMTGELMSTPSGISVDISNFIQCNYITNELKLMPGNVYLDIGDVWTHPHISPKGAQDTSKDLLLQYQSKLQKERIEEKEMEGQSKDITMTNKGSSNGINWRVRLKKTNRDKFQLLMKVQPSELQYINHYTTKDYPICGIDLGTNHFATIFDSTGKVTYVDIDTYGLFKSHRKPNQAQLKKFKTEMNNFQDELVDILIKTYSLIVIGNLDVYTDDFAKNYNLALKMECFNFSRFRNLLIRKTYPKVSTGCTVVVVDEYRTSKTCALCHFFDINQENKRMNFVCRNCKYTVDKDVNGAQNILNMLIYHQNIDYILQSS